MLKTISISLNRSFLFIGAVAFLLAACSNSSVATLNKNGKIQHPFEQLASMNWQLVSIRRGRHNPASRASNDILVNRYGLNFDDGRMRLRGGCNSVNGSVKITSPGKMQVGPMVMTNRGCNTKLMQADSEIGRTLSYVTHYRLDGQHLAMLGAKRILLFEGTPKPQNQAVNNNPLLRKARFW